MDVSSCEGPPDDTRCPSQPVISCMGHTALSGVLAPVLNSSKHQTSIMQTYSAVRSQTAHKLVGEACAGRESVPALDYSPIQQLVNRCDCDGVVKLTHVHRAKPLSAAGRQLQHAPDLEGSAATRVVSTASEEAGKHRSQTAACGHKRLCELLAECTGESAGPASDKYRFRYDTTSPEEGYSPIAGMALRPARGGQLERKASWLTHIDLDGAVCSEAVCMPLALTVRMPGHPDAAVQVSYAAGVSSVCFLCLSAHSMFLLTYTHCLCLTAVAPTVHKASAAVCKCGDKVVTSPHSRSATDRPGFSSSKRW